LLGADADADADSDTEAHIYSSHAHARDEDSVYGGPFVLTPAYIDEPGYSGRDGGGDDGGSTRLLRRNSADAGGDPGAAVALLPPRSMAGRVCDYGALLGATDLDKLRYGGEQRQRHKTNINAI
jgi:hypothetical protein